MTSEEVDALIEQLGRLAFRLTLNRSLIHKTPRNPDGPPAAKAMTQAAGLIAAQRDALEDVAKRAAQHPDDTPEDDRRDKYHCRAIALRALGRGEG